jgi:hypothetical protein
MFRIGASWECKQNKGKAIGKLHANSLDLLKKSVNRTLDRRGGRIAGGYLDTN